MLSESPNIRLPVYPIRLSDQWTILGCQHGSQRTLLGYDRILSGCDRTVSGCQMTLSGCQRALVSRFRLPVYPIRIQAVRPVDHITIRLSAW